MPEGDTIYRTAGRLRAALVGHPLHSVSSTVAAVAEAALAGRVVSEVEARGKNLLMHFDDGRVLYTHMKMTGSWHVYRESDRWAKPSRWAKLILRTEAALAVCFNAPVIELLTPLALKRHRFLSALGPDLLSPSFDFDEVFRRARRQPHLSLGEALLSQRIACGIGNVYKSETLFLCRQSPFVRLADTPQEGLQTVYDEARRLMQQNLGGGMRDTRRRDGGRYWVYGRSGQRCRKCGASIQMRRQGDTGRSTYFCPSCQGVDLTRSRP